jgi:hypothetical protein
MLTGNNAPILVEGTSSTFVVPTRILAESLAGALTSQFLDITCSCFTSSTATVTVSDSNDGRESC